MDSAALVAGIMTMLRATPCLCSDAFLAGAFDTNIARGILTDVDIRMEEHLDMSSEPPLSKAIQSCIEPSRGNLGLDVDKSALLDLKSIAVQGFQIMNQRMNPLYLATGMLGITSQFFNPQADNAEQRQQAESMMGGIGADGVPGGVIPDMQYSSEFWRVSVIVCLCVCLFRHITVHFSLLLQVWSAILFAYNLPPKHQDEDVVLVGEGGGPDADCCEILYGHGILWAAAALIHVLRQRNRYEIGDFSKAILLAPEGQMGRVSAAAPAKGAPLPRDEVQDAVDKFVESASKSERVISEVWAARICSFDCFCSQYPLIVRAAGF